MLVITCDDIFLDNYVIKCEVKILLMEVILSCKSLWNNKHSTFNITNIGPGNTDHSKHTPHLLIRIDSISVASELVLLQNK